MPLLQNFFVTRYRYFGQNFWKIWPKFCLFCSFFYKIFQICAYFQIFIKNDNFWCKIDPKFQIFVCDAIFFEFVVFYIKKSSIHEIHIHITKILISGASLAPARGIFKSPAPWFWQIPPCTTLVYSYKINRNL